MTITPDSQKTTDEALKVLQMNKDAWVALGIDERIGILDEIKNDMLKVADRWIAANMQAKGIPAGTTGEGDEWAALMCLFREIRLCRQSLVDIKKFGRPRILGPITMRHDGQVVAQVFPQTFQDRILFRGFKGEVWMEPGVTTDEAINTQAYIYRDKKQQGKIVCVLGAGNVSHLTPADFLYKLFIEDMVVILKPNPVNAYLGPLMEEGFQVLIKRDFLRIIYGGVEEGSYLCNHPYVDELHLIGSDKTFESIVFGVGPDGAKHKALHTPLINKRFTAELGNVTPVIIVPGPWSEDDIRQQAILLALWLSFEAGCQCNTPRVIVQHKRWENRKALIHAIGDVLSNVETRKAYYPGAKHRHAAFMKAHPDALQFGMATDDHLPWTFITDVDPANTNDICFKQEAFCSLFAETALEASDISEFIDTAVEFANETLWGNLNATIIVHPDSLKDPRVAEAVDRAIERLRYGNIAVNIRGDMVHSNMIGPWGGFPGNDIYDVQSGIGMTHNVLMFERPQKFVVHAPFKKSPDPSSVILKRGHEFAKRAAYFEASPSLWKLLGLLWTALRS